MHRVYECIQHGYHMLCDHVCEWIWLLDPVAALTLAYYLLGRTYMAIFNYTWDEIDRLPQPATEGEKHILHWLAQNLNDEYEVFFQPYLNGDRPDIVILRQNGGVVVIEVKDYNMDLYETSNKNTWTVLDRNGNRQSIPSPIKQVKRYKDNLIDLYVDGLAEAVVTESRNYAIIVPCVYLHCATETDLRRIEESCGYEAGKYIFFFCPSNLDNSFIEMLDTTWVSRKSRFFIDDYYYSIKKWFAPLAYEQDIVHPIELTDEQKELGKIREDRRNRRFQGVPGSGKTTILAIKAVNSYKKALETAKQHNYSRTRSILIVTFNITLRNYIQDRISMISRVLDVPYDRRAYVVLHYHEFIKAYCNNNGIEYSARDEFGALRDFELPTLPDNAERYVAILVDEIQDFQDIWVDNLSKTLSSDGVIYRFGDRNQNIYERENEGKNIDNYKMLNSTFRLNSELVTLANEFALRYVPGVARIDNSILDLFANQETPILDFKENAAGDYRGMAEKISAFVRDCGNAVHPNDYCILGGNIDTLRNIEYELKTRGVLGGNFSTVFESKETYDALRAKFASDETEYTGDEAGYVEYDYEDSVDEEALNKELRRIRKSRKFNFWNNAGKAKICTVHSFKGWEAVNGIIILEETRSENVGSPFETLVYVALTRVRKNLLIINLGGRDTTNFLERLITEYRRHLNN